MKSSVLLLLPARPASDAAISASIRSILLLMSNAITPQTTDAALRQNPDLGTALIGRVATNSGGDDPVRLMNVPSLLAEFFIEAFAVDHPRAQRHHTPKDFTRPTVIGVRLPEPILMSFASPEPGKIQFGFFHTDFETAEEFQRRVSGVLSSIAQRRMLIAQFDNVDLQNFPDAAVAAIARDLDLCMLRKSTGVDEDSECHSFVLKVMMSHWTPEKDAAVRDELARLEERARIAECADCRMWYCPADNGTCPTTRAAHTEGARVTEVRYDTSPIFESDSKYL
jgi:hypothetical protein